MPDPGRPAQPSLDFRPYARDDDLPAQGALGVQPYARDDDLLEEVRRGGGARVRVYRLETPEVVLGRGSRADTELYVDACLADAVPVTRRKGGGCAVVIDPGDVIVSAVIPAPGIGGNLQHFEELSDKVIDALARCGVPGVRREGKSDLAAHDRKVGGACIYRAQGLLYYSVCLLADPRLDLMERYLRHPPREPAYRRGRVHADFVGALSTLGDPIPAPELERRLARALAPGP